MYFYIQQTAVGLYYHMPKRQPKYHAIYLVSETLLKQHCAAVEHFGVPQCFSNQSSPGKKSFRNISIYLGRHICTSSCKA